MGDGCERRCERIYERVNEWRYERIGGSGYERVCCVIYILPGL